MNVSCGLPNVVEFVGTPASYTGLGFRSHPGYQLFSLNEIGFYVYGRGSSYCGSHLLEYTQFYNPHCHNQNIWPGFLWLLPSPVSTFHDSLLYEYYAMSFMICLILTNENIIK